LSLVNGRERREGGGKGDALRLLDLRKGGKASPAGSWRRAWLAKRGEKKKGGEESLL